MAKNEHVRQSQIAKDSAIPSVTIRIPLPTNVKPPAKTPVKSIGR